MAPSTLTQSICLLRLVCGFWKTGCNSAFLLSVMRSEKCCVGFFLWIGYAFSTPAQTSDVVFGLKDVYCGENFVTFYTWVLILLTSSQGIQAKPTGIISIYI